MIKSSIILLNVLRHLNVKELAFHGSQLPAPPPAQRLTTSNVKELPSPS